MIRWYRYLAEAPPSLLRLIAASQRVSLPRRCDPDERLRRLRRAICRPVAVRELFFSLAPAEQTAAQALAAAPAGAPFAAALAALGPIRPLAALRADRAPRSPAERFLLLGWVLPRPGAAARRPMTNDQRPMTDGRRTTDDGRPQTDDRGRPARPTPYRLAPELRGWLPKPLALGGDGDASEGAVGAAARCGATGDVGDTAVAVAPGVRAAAAIVLAAARAPLPLRADGRPAAATLRRIAPLLAPAPPETTAALCTWLLPLLTDVGALAPTHGRVTVEDAPGRVRQPDAAGSAAPALALGPTARRFLAAGMDDQRATLREAWVHAPQPDRWLCRMRVSTVGLDAPALRRRLLSWAAALPADRPLAVDATGAALTASFGPLADGYTHGLRPLRRTPWNPARAAAVWQAALEGPLAWLGEVAPLGDGQVVRPGPAPTAPPAPWRVGGLTDDRRPTTNDAQPIADAGPATDDGPARESPRSRMRERGTGGEGHGARPDVAGAAEPLLVVPHAAIAADLLELQPFVYPVGADAAGTGYRLSRATVAGAVAAGHPLGRLRDLLARRVGALPPAWAALLAPAADEVRMVRRCVLLSDQPQTLSALARQPGVGATIEAQLAPGVALVQPGKEAALSRALARAGVAAAAPPAPTTPPAADLSPAERALLLAMATHYRATLPADGPPGPSDALLARLGAGLPAGMQPVPCPVPHPAPGAPPAPAAIPPMSDHAQAGAACRAPDGASAHGDAMNDQRPAASGQGHAAEAPALAPEAALGLLRGAIRTRRAVWLRYQGAAGPETARWVRPLRLERHGAHWLLYASCMQRRAERCFRVDRMQAVQVLARRARPPAPAAPEAAPGAATTPPPAPAPGAGARGRGGAGFVAPPTGAAPDTPPAAVWLI